MTDTMTVETVKIMPSDPEQGDYVVINATDFDPAVHALLGKAGPEAIMPLTAKAGSLHVGSNSVDDGMTKAEVMAKLKAFGVAFQAARPKAELLALLKNETKECP